ncbi:hypothetical protein N0V85_006102 [Neurospora sp. IMI 360204]|nr:hypothetical protein N0V85_006102 [Neurospora sp. IMI 360204]
MLARSAWTWIVLIAAWASLVASKSPAVAYEMIFGYHTYNTAWKYRGVGQGVIFRQLDPEKDKTLFDASYKQKGHRGSLAQGQMDWKEFTLAWLRDNKLGPGDIPELDQADLGKTAKKLMDLSAKAKMELKVQLATGEVGPPVGGDSQIAAELEGMRLASERARFIRRANFTQVQYLGDELKREFPGIEVKSELIALEEFQEVREVVNVQATLTDPKNRENMPKALGLSSADDCVSKFMERVDNYGVVVGKPKKEMTDDERKAVSHRRVLATVEEFQRAAGKNVCK